MQDSDTHFLGRPIFTHGLLVLTGACLTLAFAPFHLWFFAVLAPAILLILLSAGYTNMPKAAFGSGWLFGCGFFATGIYWLYISLHTYGLAAPPLAALMTFLVILLLGFYIACVTYSLNRYFPNHRLSKYLLAFPSLWVLGEWIRGWLFTGFPWLFLGYTQLSTPLSGFAPLVGVFGISWMVASTAGACAWAILACYHRKQNRIGFYRKFCTCVIYLGSMWTAGYLLEDVHWTHPTGTPLPVHLVQGNIAQTVKWIPNQAERTLKTYLYLSQSVWQTGLTVWPEAALTFSGDALTRALLQLKDTLPNTAALVTGLIRVEDGQFYNALTALGRGSGTYRKRHLVPFGEFIPVRDLLAWFSAYVQIPMSDFTKGERYQPLVTVHNIPIASFICYEIAYPMEILDALPRGQFLLVVSDDSWFGKSIALPQHLQIARMRALETGRDLLMSTNDGITAIVDSQGILKSQAPAFSAFVLNGNIQPKTGSTPWVAIGKHTRLYLFLIMGAAFLGLSRYWNKP